MTERCLQGEQCKDCKWWELIEDGPELAQNNAVERGRCHRMPPTATPIVMPTINKITRQMIPQVIETTTWPITLPVMWCGEFEKAKKPMEVSEEVTGMVA